MPINDQKLHRFAMRTFAIGLLIIGTGAVLQLTKGHQAIGLDPAAYGNATIFGLLARVGGTVALIGLVGFGLRAARRPVTSTAIANTVTANSSPPDTSSLPPHAQRADSAPAPRLPSRIRPVRIPPRRIEHTA